MKKLFSFVSLSAAMVTVAAAAPLFPDAKDSHWAYDAVRALAAKGLIEGYPDGTFKGDRSASRYEIAMLLARLLAKEAQIEANFATKEERRQLQALLDELRPELEALGVRVTSLEQTVSRLDKRVVELERIKFYGSVETRVVAQSFKNDGQPDNDSSRAGGGKKGIPYQDYNSLIGTSAAATVRPQQTGLLPEVDFTNGRALVNGAGFTSKAILGLNVKVSPDVDAGIEFAAYSSQGNQAVNDYWGVYAPYLQNPFTANPGAAPTEQNNNAPFSRMTLDHVWIEHKPSQTRIVLGYFDSMEIDRFIFNGQPNLFSTGPRTIPGYGFNVSGIVPLGERESLKWEALGTRFADLNSYAGDNYQHYVLGGDVAYRFDRGQIKIDFARYNDEVDSGGPNVVGLNKSDNFAYGASSGWTPAQWVNPAGYYVNQRSDFANANTGAVNGTYIPNTVDTRPIPGWNATADNAIGIKTGGGNFGPQGQTMYGASAKYAIPLGEPKEQVRFLGEYGHSDFKPSNNSPYSRGGDLFRFEVGANLLDGNLDLGLNYLSVDPSYMPAMFANDALGSRPVRNFNFVGRYFLFDTQTYPNNRDGLRFLGSYAFDDNHGKLTWKLGWLEQKDTSLYDVRVLGGSLGPSIPTNNVIGFSPGFFDSVFSGFANPNVYGSKTANSFTDKLEPMENPRGSQHEFGLGFSYKWDSPDLRLDTNYERNEWARSSSLTANMGGSQNFVNVSTDYGLLKLTWTAAEDWSVRFGSELVKVQGHHDPGGLYNGYAVKNQSIDFQNINTIQTIPFVGFDHKISQSMTWSTDFRYYMTTDHVSSSVNAGLGSAYIGYSQHPYSWSGPQLSSEFKFSF